LLLDILPCTTGSIDGNAGGMPGFFSFLVFFAGILPYASTFPEDLYWDPLREKMAGGAQAGTGFVPQWNGSRNRTLERETRAHRLPQVLSV